MSKYKIEKTNKFKKDYKKMQSRNNFNETEFFLLLWLFWIKVLPIYLLFVKTISYGIPDSLE